MRLPLANGDVPIPVLNVPLLSTAEYTPWSSPMIRRAWPVSGSTSVMIRCWSVPAMSNGIHFTPAPLLVKSFEFVTVSVAPAMNGCDGSRIRLRIGEGVRPLLVSRTGAALVLSSTTSARCC